VAFFTEIAVKNRIKLDFFLEVCMVKKWSVLEHILKITVLVAMVCALIACSGSDPSQAELASAIKADLESSILNASGGGVAVPGIVKDVRIAGCNNDDKERLVCEAVIRIKLAGGDMTTTRAFFLLTQKHGAWTAKEFHSRGDIQ